LPSEPRWLEPAEVAQLNAYIVDVITGDQPLAAFEQHIRSYVVPKS
jgi:hypothetical protein